MLQAAAMFPAGCTRAETRIKEQCQAVARPVGELSPRTSVRSQWLWGFQVRSDGSVGLVTSHLPELVKTCGPEALSLYCPQTPHMSHPWLHSEFQTLLG